MADAMEALKGLLGDENQLKSMVSSLTSGVGLNNGNNDGNEGGGSNVPDLDYIMQMKELMGKLGSGNNDPRYNLLMSLKPDMRTRRQASIDNAVKMLNFVKLASLFK